MKVTDREPDGTRRAYTLTPWTEPHPKRGEAFHVDHEGRRLGDVLRWERDEVTTRIGSSRASFVKWRVTYWTAYRQVKPDETVGAPSKSRTLESRADALRWLRSL